MITKELHYNYPQLRSMLIGAPEEWLIAGRGTGKTEGVLAYKSANCYMGTMPRGTGVNVGATFAQLLTRTLPSLFYGWEKLGYKRENHYLVGEKPTAKWKKMWKWDGPLRMPEDFSRVITWHNGAIMLLSSQDRPGNANGTSIDWIIGDEAKLLNRDKLVGELFPANRGIVHEFKDNPYHHGKTFTTDMPVGTSGRWILDKVNDMHTERIQEILKLKRMVYLLQDSLHDAGKMEKKRLQGYINLIEQDINEIRLGKMIDERTGEREEPLMLYHEASTLDNIHALGFNYIKTQLRDSTQFEFDTQILNIRPMRMEDGFYPDLDEDLHGYFAHNYSFIDSIGYNIQKLQDRDCRFDADLDMEEPIHIALDYNRRLFPLVAAQTPAGEIRMLNAIHVEYPLKTRHVLDLFVSYYRFHKNKVVYYWYDHTAMAEQDYTPVADFVVNYLESKGWSVVRMYVGHGLTHEARYRMWGELLQNSGLYNRVFRMNRDNCSWLFKSMFLAGAEKRDNGFGKDKSTEKDPKFPAQESTHYSEAGDVLVGGILESRLSFTVSHSDVNEMHRY
jgi:hypothetical protein